MDLRFSDEDEAFRAEARAWLDRATRRRLRRRQGPGRPRRRTRPVRRAPRVGAATSARAAGPASAGPRSTAAAGCSLHQQVIWFEEYARAGGPGRLGHIGEGLARADDHARSAAPSSRPASCRRIVAGTELWAQGYSEPNAGSDLANVQTRAELDGDEWVITGQKVWTSLAHWSDWCFVLARTDRERSPSTGASRTCLMPMEQDGVEIRPIRQITGDQRVQRGLLRRRPRRRPTTSSAGSNDGWKVAMGTARPSSGARPRSASRWLPQRARRDRRAWPRRNGRARRPGHAATAGGGARIGLRDHAVEHAARAVGSRRLRPRSPARP